MNVLGKKLFDRTDELLQRSMDIRTSRHRVLSSNIANSETPDFAPRDIPFEKIMERTIALQSTMGLKRTHEKHLPGGFPSEIDIEKSSETVNIDKEMAKLAENNLRFQADVQALVRKLEGLKYAIEGGR
jgi:flagellar basal-body rod protein FlgB